MTSTNSSCKTPLLKLVRDSWQNRKTPRTTVLDSWFGGKNPSQPSLNGRPSGATRIWWRQICVDYENGYCAQGCGTLHPRSTDEGLSSAGCPLLSPTVLIRGAAKRKRLSWLSLKRVHHAVLLSLVGAVPCFCEAPTLHVGGGFCVGQGRLITVLTFPLQEFCGLITVISHCHVNSACLFWPSSLVTNVCRSVSLLTRLFCYFHFFPCLSVFFLWEAEIDLKQTNTGLTRKGGRREGRDNLRQRKVWKTGTGKTKN